MIPVHIKRNTSPFMMEKDVPTDELFLFEQLLKFETNITNSFEEDNATCLDVKQKTTSTGRGNSLDNSIPLSTSSLENGDWHLNVCSGPLSGLCIQISKKNGFVSISVSPHGNLKKKINRIGNDKIQNAFYAKINCPVIFEE